MKPITHNDCLGVRGIMTFKCLRCGEETKTCQICGKKIK